MCGIAGLVLEAARPDEPALRARAAVLNDALAHRGPDGEGVWTDPAAGVALAQRRLAIVDLTPTGAQPMLAGSGRLAMTYNGEIYNFRELRRQLEAEGARFRGTSDSEVLLEAWDRWGRDRALAALNGMFAIAIWDRAERRLTLARDRFGIKPLLWFRAGGVFAFASELKALLRDPACPRTIDSAAIAAVLRHGAVPAPWSAIDGVAKLEPGAVLTWSPGAEPRIERYWSPLDAMAAGAADPNRAPFETLADEAEALIGDAVERQMIADVPLGAFLSGGVDSSLVAALAQARAGRPVETFTIGFEEPEWDESPHAEAVAAHLGTRHRTLRTSGREALALAEAMGRIYDEPFADSSQLPTVLLSRLVRGHVTVALSGDGGDEAFAGYARHGWGLAFERYRRGLPRPLRRGAAALAEAAPLAALERLAPAGFGGHAGHKLRRAARLGAAPDFVEGYRGLAALADPAPLMARPGEHHAAAFDPAATAALASPLARMQAIDALSYLPDDILTKVDRASMSVGLEVRVPLLDHRIWEWATRLPDDVRRSGREGKRLLKAVLARHLPRPLFERPKAGFAVPLARWLRHDLKPWAHDLLRSPGLAGSGLFDRAAVDRLWAAHQAGREDHAPALWSILMIESWRRAVFDAR